MHLSPTSLAALGSGAAACLLMLFVTSGAGPGISPDSISYLSAAQSLIRTGDMRSPSMLEWEVPADTIPYAGFPPGYPAAIAVPLALNASPVESARAIQAVSAFVTVVVAVLLAGSAGGPAIGILAAVMILSSPAVLYSHMYVFSEPLFFAAFFLTLMAMVRSPGRPWLAGLASAVALLIRFAGAGATLAAVLWTLLQPGKWRERLKRAAIVFAPSAIVLAAWMIRTRIVSSRAHGGESEFVGDPFPMLLLGGPRRSLWKGFGSSLYDGFDSFFDWLIPLVSVHLTDARYRTAMLAFVVTAISVMLLHMAGGRNVAARAANSPNQERGRLWGASGILAGSYITILLLARLVDPWLTFDARILAPLMVIGVLGFVTVLGAWWPNRPRLMRGIIVTGICVWLSLAITLNARLVQSALQEGIGVSSLAMKSSPLVRWTRENARSRSVFSNDFGALIWNAGSDARALPFRLGASWRDPYPQPIDTALALAFGDTLVRRNGLVIVFDEINPYMIAPDSLVRLLSLNQIARLSDGGVWAPGAETLRVLEAFRGIRIR
ncbi:MAG: hypothetical protein ACR2G6_17640 [Gemmatimonadaceae bacterium]